MIERLAVLLTARPASAADMHAARIWRGRARALGAFAIGAGEPASEHSCRDTDDGNAGAGFEDFGFHHGIPVWRLRVAGPDSLSGGEVVFRAFLLPEGALLACLVRFECPAGRLVLAHRVFDVTDPAVETYIAGSEHHLRWRTEIYDARRVGRDRPRSAGRAGRRGRGRSEGQRADDPPLEQVLAHNAALGTDADVGSAYAFLTATFREYATSYGVEAAWSALVAACAPVAD